jgi:site-specific DNA recombinase
LPTDYSDGGYTGGTLERPALQKLLSDIQRDRIDCVVVYKVDRLSRSLMDFAQMIAVFEQHDVSFVSVTQHFDTSTSMGRLILNVLLSFAQFEREIIGERIRDKKLATARQGKYVGGQPFLGYDIDRERKRLIANPAEAEIVREIFESFIRTRSSLAVARALNAKGYRTKEYKVIKNGKVAGGRSWNKVAVYRVLTNRKYLGEIVHKGKSYPGEHQPILDRRLWDQAHEIMSEKPGRRASATKLSKNPAMLRGIVRCGHCGTTMGIGGSVQHGKRYRYYVCNNAERNGYDACPVPSVAAGQIEGAVKERLHVMFRSPEMIARTFREARVQTVQRRAELTSQKERLEARLADLKRAIGRLARSDGSGGETAAELARLNEEYGHVQGQVEEANHALEALGAGGATEDEMRDALQKLEPLWDELFPVEKTRIVKLLVQEVVVKTDGLLIRLHLHGLNSLVAELVGDGRAVPTGDGETLDIDVPMALKYRAGRREIILPQPDQVTLKAEPNPPLVLALARAYRWQRMLDSGEVAGVEAIAAQHGVDRTYVSRILGLAMLAPEVVRAIMKGDEPSGLSLRKLTAKPLPVRWDEQRVALGL